MERTKGRNRVKKSIFTWIVIVLCIGSMVSCNAKEKQIEEGKQIEEAPIQKDTRKVGMVYIGEEMYDLTKEPKEVIGNMVTDGVIVVESLIGDLYDTNGKISEKDYWELKNEGGELGNLVEVHIDNVSVTYSSNVILEEFILGQDDTVYRTWDGITAHSEEEDIKNLETYVPCAIRKDRAAYACIYVDGNPVSLQIYEEPLEELMKAKEEKRLQEAFKEYLKEVSYVPKAISCLRRGIGLDRLKVYFDNEEIEGTLWLMLAAQDAGQRLETAEITSYDIVVYEKTEDGMLCKVYHHYYDDTWVATKYLERGE